MKAKYIIGGIIIVVFLIWGSTELMKSTQYVSIAEAATSDRVVQVMGKVDREAVHFDVAYTSLEFTIYDPEAEEKQKAQHLAVVYGGQVPGNFDQAREVRCESL